MCQLNPFWDFLLKHPCLHDPSSYKHSLFWNIKTEWSGDLRSMLFFSVLSALSRHLQGWLKQANLVATRLAASCRKTVYWTWRHAFLLPILYWSMLSSFHCLSMIMKELTFSLFAHLSLFWYIIYIYTHIYIYIYIHTHNPPITKRQNWKWWYPCIFHFWTHLPTRWLCFRRCLLGSHGMRPALGRWSEARRPWSIGWCFMIFP